MKRFIAIWILLSAGLNIWQMDRIRERTAWQTVYSDYQRLWDFRSYEGRV